VDVKQRNNEGYGEDTKFQTKDKWQSPPFANGPISPVPPEYNDLRATLDSLYDENGYVCLQQNYPMPVTLLAEVPEVSVGDTPDD